MKKPHCPDCGGHLSKDFICRDCDQSFDEASIKYAKRVYKIKKVGNNEKKNGLGS